MIDNGPDGFALIGLHKLAAQNGDGLVPELYELLMRRANDQRRAANVATLEDAAAGRGAGATARCSEPQWRKCRCLCARGG